MCIRDRAKRAGDATFEIWGTGKPIREWLYVEDLARVLADAVTMDAELLEPVNIGQNRGHSIRELAEIIAQAVGYEGELTYNTSYQDGAPKKVMDDAKFKTLFPDFQFCEMPEGLKRAVAYYDSLLSEEE